MLSRRVQRIKPSPTLAITAKEKAMKAAGIDVIGFGAGEPDFDTPDPIKEAAIAAIRGGFTKYTEVGGIPDLKDAIIEKLKRDNGLAYTRDEILISNGGKHSLYNAAQALFDDGDEIIIPAPYWVSYPDQALLNDAKPVIIPTSDKAGFKITPEQLERSINARTKAFILNSPSNPTGAAYDASELAALARVLEKHKNVVCLSDEIYEKIVYDGFKPVSIASLSPELKKRTLIVNGVSKVFSMTGWRMGFAAGPSEWIKAMSNVQGQSTSNVSSITQKAALAAYLGSQEFLKSWLIEFDRRRKFVVERLNKISGIRCLLPQGAFYVFPNISALFGRKSASGKKIATSADFSAYLLEEHKVAVVSGEGFGAEGYIRLSYATSMENIKKGIDRIEKAASQLK